MTQCSEIRPDLKAYLDNELPTPTNKVVADHLGVCDECSHLLSEMRKVGQVLSSMEKPAEFAFDPKLRAKILSALPTASSPAPKGRVFWPWGRGFQVAGLSAALAALVVVMVVNRNSMDEVNMRSSAESPASGSAASAPKFPSDSARQSESQQKDVSRQENAGTASANDKKAQVEFKNTVGGVADSNRHLNSKQALPKSNDARKSPAIAPSSDAMKLFGSQFDRTASGSTEPDFTRIPPVTGSGATLELKIGKPAVPAPASGKGVDALATKDAPNEKSLARSGIGERPVAPTADSNQMGRGIGRNLSSTRSNIEQLENEVHKVTLVVDSLD
ncbi:MAG: zf-HC2 domain-containing protein, partial [Chthonomonadales bacterium]